VGKSYQALDDLPNALIWFEKAYQINPSHPDIARETSLCAMHVGQNDLAITFAHRAVQVEPNNYGLHANLALAYLLAGKIELAQASIDCALSGDPTDNISQTIKLIVQHFAQNGKSPPTTTPKLMAYWKNHPR